MTDGRVESQSEELILKSCIELMHELVGDFEDWYRWIHGDDAIEKIAEEERFCIRKSYLEIIRHLFLYHTSHSGGTSTIQKCNELNVEDWSEEVEFGFEAEDYDE